MLASFKKVNLRRLWSMVIQIFRTVPVPLLYPSLLEQTLEGFSTDLSNVLIIFVCLGFSNKEI